MTNIPSQATDRPAIKDWLAQPGPALLHVHVNPMQLVMPPFTQVEPAIGMALYSLAPSCTVVEGTSGKW
jgi:hypothetical protein